MAVRSEMADRTALVAELLENTRQVEVRVGEARVGGEAFPVSIRRLLETAEILEGHAQVECSDGVTREAAQRMPVVRNRFRDTPLFMKRDARVDFLIRGVQR